MSPTDPLTDLLDRWEALRDAGQEATAEDLCPGRPDLAAPLAALIRELKAMDWLDRTAEGACPCGGPGGQLSPPAVLAGRYRLDRRIASGGFAEVWRATDSALDRAVAVKLTTENCVAEARRVARLRHPGIVSVHDVGHEGGYCFIVFDLVDGPTLADRLRAGPLPWRESATLAATAAEHLQYAHDRGFIHRDVKPANILLDEHGRPVLADFGIAVTAAELQTETVTTVGTLAYMAPEQLTVGGALDVRTDVYALGVVLYEMLTGQPPFHGRTVAAVRDQILHAAPPALPEPTPPALAAVVRRCLAKQADERYPTALAVQQALQAVLEPPVSFPRPDGGTVGRRRSP